MDRRTFLKGTAGAAGVTALAGCMGGGNGDGSGDGSGDDGGSGGGDADSGSSDGGSGPTDMVMTTSTETTAAYAMSQGIAAVVNENSEEVRLDARPSEGTNANIGRLDREEIQIAYIQNWTAAKINAGEEPFGNLSFTPNQVFHLYDLGWFFATANDGWETAGDIESGSRVSPAPRGAGTAEMLETALGYSGADYNRVSIDYGSQGSAMSEGRLDVGVSTLVNFSIEPGWLQEMKGTTDLRMLGWSDETVAKMEEDPGLLLTEVDTGDLENYAYTPDPVVLPSLAYNFVVRNDFSYDAVYNLLSTMWEQREGLGEYHGLLNNLADGEFWVKNAYDGVPFHPAAADFYEEQGLWSDEFTRGEE
ncbi:substrate-binding domain-containing protein [Salinirubellus salinus]|uniref:Substrate-binding domain-containing protein n=1 Tax=Salinirubellus salinus TaxID=1364945 RepID=A0A9E7U9N5_9EURY|nr:substrate-binding domain-containing protein [Salinirubellus salinus]UWM53207.1 substrate-binding domain-containing protein [Salinirubellus salinus]